MTNRIGLLVTIALAGACAGTGRVVSPPLPALPGSAMWADSAAREIERASVSGDIDRLHRTQTLLDRALVAYPNDPLLLHYQGYAYYREAGILSGRPKAEATGIPLVLATAQTKLEQSLAGQQMAETHALLANVLGQLIGVNQANAPTLGPRVQQEMNAAVGLGPNNPRVWLLRGIQSLYTPAQYGGGVDIAESQVNKAIELFTTDAPQRPAPSWGRAEAYVWLGQVLQKENKLGDARTAYQRALAIQPDYPWVTYSLLPSLDR
ncbi:MAG: tetratricopeptide repeat protein [Gemmatimonadaceae bacterium]